VTQLMNSAEGLTEAIIAGTCGKAVCMTGVLEQALAHGTLKRRPPVVSIIQNGAHSRRARAHPECSC